MKKNLIFIAVFIILGLITLQIPFSNLLGANVKFTLYDFLAPSLGAFIGTVPGIIAVFATQIINLAIHGSASINQGSLIHLFPTLFAVFYFSKKRSVNVLIPLIAIIGFNLHPIGRSAWQYSLFWLIPIAAHFYRKNLFVRSLGATFTAHAVGGLLWVWAFGLTKTLWLALIPQTLMERTLFAAGIAVSYVVISNILNFAEKKKLIPSLHLEKHYLLK